MATIQGGRDGGEGSGDPVAVTDSVVEVSQPDGDWSAFHIDGRINTAAIGGTGILISTVDNRLDPALGLGLTREEDESVIATTDDVGILYVEFADGTTRSVNLDEVGVDREHIYMTSWWFSEDGIEWALQSDESSIDAEILGTAQGFYAVEGSSIWFTSRGSSWQEIGTVTGEHGVLTRSGRGAVFASGEGLYLLNPEGIEEYVVEDLPTDSFPSAASEDGILAVQHWNGEVELKLFYAVPGKPFELEDVPPEMEAADVFGAYFPSYAAFGNRYLLLLFEEDFVPAFWTKDFPPN